MGSQNSKSLHTGSSRVESSPLSTGPGLDGNIQLKNLISEFLRLYEDKIKRLMEMTEKLERCQAEKQRIEKQAKTGKMVVAVASGAGAVLDMLTGGLDGGALTGLSAGLGRFGVGIVERISTKKNNKKSTYLREEYTKITEGLKRKLQDIVQALERLTATQTCAPDTHVFEMLHLKSQLSDAIASLRLSQSDASERAERLKEFRNKTELLKPRLKRV